MDSTEDEWLWGWDQTPGIVSVWARRDGRVVYWRRDGEEVVATPDRFRPWVVAASLDDLAHIGDRLRSESASDAARALITYRELDGPADSYRFLLSAASGDALERTLLAGASRRLDHSVANLHELDDDYYRVGPVEQYLMLTGKVYFRGLAYDDLHRLQFDLETTALDPERGRIFMVAVRDNRGLARTLEAPAARDEPRLIADLAALIRARDPDVIENHNLHGFDLPFLVGRAERLRAPLALGRADAPAAIERYGDPQRHRGRRRMRYSVPGRELIDTLDAVLRYDFSARDLPSYRLKEVARHFGVATAERVYLPGAAVYATYKHDPDTVRRYALDDVAEVDGLSRRLLGAPFALAAMAPRRYERLASAGPAMGILEPMLVRAYLRAGAALPRVAPPAGAAADPHLGGGVHLFATGVAEHVVKADIASLYPSLMRTYGIGPDCDRLGVLLSLVARLTDLRLAHKAEAREAGLTSTVRGHHDTMQAAMKILINSAYGYMGAGSMALFADAAAAGEVTRRGREVLQQVIDALAGRGMALIEADTDGVFFAVPADWDETRERALVAAVAAELPDGIRLEYEGRYAAMFSHEVKNYALLGYNGELTMRGVALRSSRSEPFGETFLRRAMRCTLLGDIAGVRHAFLDTLAELRERRLPASELAARVRLTKSAEAYLATRSSHVEPHYEALLSSGRTAWAPGERVRFYRRRDKQYRWLPDETEDQPDDAAQSAAELADGRDYDVQHYVDLLAATYAGRLRKAFAPVDFAQLFRADEQLGLFDLPVEHIEPLWIRCRRGT